jgi:hypothetical protein
MGPELSLLIGALAGGTGAMLSFWAGWLARDRQGPLRGSYGAPRRRGSNPPPPGTKPQPPSGPPQPLAAHLIRYWAWQDDQIRQAFTEGRTQRGNGNGGPTTPKPQPAGGRLIGADGMTIGYRPIPSRPNPAPTHPHASHDLSAFI